MTFTQSIGSVFGKYAVFSGRASRSEYWYFTLAMFIVNSILVSLSGVYTDSPSIFWSSVMSIFGLAVLIPSLAVSVRRMHDIGKGGGWIFITLVPLVGWIWYLVLCCTASQPGGNRFGPYPEEHVS
ncbi:MAG: DUF805 domain-containing protein [Muribaculaceae bacterium]|nr:DUF805 domain-containing protein [Muribaculaceae bacterium]